MKYRFISGRTYVVAIVFLFLITTFSQDANFLLQASPKQNPQVNTVRPIAQMAETGNETELQKAAKAGDLTSLQGRLRQGINPDAPNPSGRTALLEAIVAGKNDAVRLLLTAGARVNGISPSGPTPLIEAVQHGNTDVVQLLIQNGANIDLTQRGFGTALETAERTGNREAAAMLRQAGAHTFGRSVGDTVCVRPWGGDGYCGTVEDINKNNYQIRVTRIIGCVGGCEAKEECSAGKPVGGSAGLGVGDVITTVSWCLTHTGVQP